jgi:hypothetical protein
LRRALADPATSSGVQGLGGEKGGYVSLATVPVAAEWADTLREGIRAFSRSRRVGSPAVQVTLADGESFFLMRAEPAPGDDWISLYPYPAGRLDEMIQDADAEGELTTPRVVIIHPEMVAKIELLVEPDEARRGHLLGFRLQDDGE